MSVLRKFLETARKNPDKPVYVDERGVFSMKRVADSALRFGAIMGSMTERPNVGVMLPNIKEYGVAFFAILAAGKTPVPLNYLLEQPELDYIYEDAGLDTIVAVDAFREKVEGKVPNVMYMDQLASMAQGGALADMPVPEPRPQDQLALILYTSGTIGKPKGVMLSNENLHFNVMASMEAFGIYGHERFVGVLPLFHTFGITGLLLLPAFAAIPVYFHARFNPGAVLASIKEHRLTHMLAVASMYRILSRAARKDPPDSLQVCVSGGEPLPEQTRVEFQEVFGFPLFEGYGLTEHSPVVCINTHACNKPGTAGPLIPGVECRIAGDDGAALPLGKEGEIWLRSPSVMRGYFKHPEETAEHLTPDGWLKTGDLGVLDEDRCLAITGRKKELIISSGENIAPGEIEDALLEHPAVFEAAAIGVPDKTRGEVPKGFVALLKGEKTTESELREFLAGRLAAFKVPRTIEFLDELPHGPTGKILKKKLRQREGLV